MTLTENELLRYKKHLQLQQVGRQGQQKLKEASILVVGAGGLGSPVLMYLAGAGVGHITIIDDDRVSLSNLSRQIIHTTNNLEVLPVESARMRLQELNPEIQVDVQSVKLDSQNAEKFISGNWPVVDCTDNIDTRFLLNETCARLSIPLVYGAVFEFEGQISVFDARRGPCLRCMIPEMPPDGALADPQLHGLLNTVPGVIGLLQATEVLKLILGIGQPLIGKLLLFDSLTATLQTIRLNKRPDCLVCGRYESHAKDY